MTTREELFARMWDGPAANEDRAPPQHVSPRRRATASVLPAGRISLSEAVTWLAYGKPRRRADLRRIERRRPVAFRCVKAALDAAFASLLPALMDGAILASGVLVQEWHWDTPPDAFDLPQPIDPARFAPSMAFRYGADSIDLPPDGVGDDEKAAIWARAAASDAGAYQAFVNVSIDAAALARAFPPSPKTGDATKRRGRGAQYPWCAFDAELHRLIEHHGLPHPSDPEWSNAAAAERTMTEWALSNWGRTPSESTIRDRVSKSIRARKADK